MSKIKIGLRFTMNVDYNQISLTKIIGNSQANGFTNNYLLTKQIYNTMKVIVL